MEMDCITESDKEGKIIKVFGQKMRFEINDEPILYVNYGNDSWAGICDWEEAKQVALQNRLVIDDSEAEWKTEEDYL